MFAHQAIEDLRVWLTRLSPDYFHDLRENIKHTINLITVAQKFHISYIKGLFDSTKRFIGRELFSGETEIRCPFPLCWIDFMRDQEGIPSEHRCTKRAALLQQVTQNTFNVILFAYVNSIKMWGTPVNMYRFEQGSPTRYSHFSLMGSADNTDLLLDEDLGDLTATNLALLFLNCINIGTEKHVPSAKLNRARTKKGKQELFTYHTLVLKPVGQHQASIPKHLWENRIHLARGHFKTYTPERPLFGRIVGRFWWQPCLRGKNKDGIVLKDYVVAT